MLHTNLPPTDDPLSPSLSTKSSSSSMYNPKRVKDNGHPCLASIVLASSSNNPPGHHTWPTTLLYKAIISHINSGGTPSVGCLYISLSQGMVSNALQKSTKQQYNLHLCAFASSIRLHSVKIWSRENQPTQELWIQISLPIHWSLAQWTTRRVWPIYGLPS